VSHEWFWPQYVNLVLQALHLLIVTYKWSTATYTNGVRVHSGPVVMGLVAVHLVVAAFGNFILYEGGFW
jgi:hypothetical protein